MKKKLFFFIFFLGSLLVHGQTEYGVLIRSTMNLKTPGSMTTRYTIEGRKDELLRFSTRNILPTSQAVVVQYDFFYTRDVNELYFIALEQNGSGQVNCVKEYTIPYNPTTSNQENFGGCIGNSNAWTIHLTQPSANNVCSNDVINLNNGWNWEYQYDSNGWKTFPSLFQGKRSISFKLTDIDGYDGKSQIFFRAGYQSQFTNIVTYNIISCSPDLRATSSPNITFCNYGNGEVTFTFSRPLANGEKYLFNRNLVGNGFVTSSTSNDAEVEKISPLSYKWKNIPPGNYEFKYQTQFGTNNPSTLSAVSNFTITPRAPLTFTATAVQPVCSTDKAGILITASGGSNSYFYLLDDEPLTQKHPFTNPYTISITTDGDHKVTIVDEYDCIEK